MSAFLVALHNRKYLFVLGIMSSILSALGFFVDFSKTTCVIVRNLAFKFSLIQFQVGLY